MPIFLFILDKEKDKKITQATVRIALLRMKSCASRLFTYGKEKILQRRKEVILNIA